MPDFTDDDYRLLNRVGTQPLTLADLDRLTALAKQNDMPPSSLVLEAQRLRAAIGGDAEPQQPEPGQPTTANLQAMSQTELWALSEQQAAQRREQ